MRIFVFPPVSCIKESMPHILFCTLLFFTLCLGDLSLSVFRDHLHSFVSQRQINSVQSLSHVQLFATPCTAARQASLSIANSWSLLKLMSVESVMPSNHLILCQPFSSRLQSFPASVSFQMSQFFASGGQSIGVSASTSFRIRPLPKISSSPLLFFILVRRHWRSWKPNSPSPSVN